MSGERIISSWWPHEIEHVGQTKLKDAGTMAARNLQPASLWLRYCQWYRRIQLGVIHKPRNGTQWLWMGSFMLMASQYAFRYNFSPLIKKHQWRKYH